MSALTQQEREFVFEYILESFKLTGGPAFAWFREHDLVPQAIAPFGNALGRNRKEGDEARLREITLDRERFKIPESIEIPWRDVEHMKARARELAPDVADDVETRAERKARRETS